MKKLFTLFAAVLMAGSMMAKDVTFNGYSSAWARSGSTLAQTIDGVTVTISWPSTLEYERMTYICFNGYPSFGDLSISATSDDSAITGASINGNEQTGEGPWTVHIDKDQTVSITSITIHLEDEAVDVTFGAEGFSQYSYYKNDSTWRLRWQGREQSSETHTLVLYRATNLDSKFGHFTTADFDLTESYFTGAWVGELVTEIDVTFTETEYGFTMSGSVVAADGNTYNLIGEYAAPKATPSVTSFTTLSELDGLTITLSGVEVQSAGQDGSIYLTDESLDVLYGEGHNYTFSSNILTIEDFVYVAGEMDPLPEEGKDMIIYTGGVFAGYRDLILCTIHFDPTPTALENTTAEVKATKLVENGQMVIIREGVKYNAVGAKL